MSATLPFFVYSTSVINLTTILNICNGFRIPDGVHQLCANLTVAPFPGEPDVACLYINRQIAGKKDKI